VLGLAVVQDPAAAEEQQVEALELAGQLVAQGAARVDHALDPVVRRRVLHVAGENGQLRAAGHGAQLLERHREDGLVADVEPAVRTADADRRPAARQCLQHGAHWDRR
jgi:hypothetical protein